ncbi:Nn.00g093590.m01.CDS01 [Neocucurbitaria sp. VM-36]
MDAFSSPMRLIPPMTPRRAPSPTMSPGGRRGRAYGSSEEGRLRDLSPDTTLRAFTQQPMPFDTTQDEYKILSCIEALTAAERDLGARVAKAAQRLKSWCAEIEQWGWSGTFEQPSAEVREQRRRSLELRIREHVPDADLTKTLRPLEYWGSLLSDEVEQHDARLDDIEDEMLKLDVEELKEHVLDMHPAGRSRPSSAGFEAARQNYKLMDDFSFLITQTLLSALPHHAQLKDRLLTWTARVSILREAPRYLSELETAQKAMRLGWDAIELPTDASDPAFAQWKEAVDTISSVLQDKVSDLGRRLDKMLDTLEGREDCLPDNWIDVFESIEADYGRWAHESRRRVIDFDVRRRVDKGLEGRRENVTEQLEPHSTDAASLGQQKMSHPHSIASQNSTTTGNDTKIEDTKEAVIDSPSSTKDFAGLGKRDPLSATVAAPRPITAISSDIPGVPNSLSGSRGDITSNKAFSDYGAEAISDVPQDIYVDSDTAKPLSAQSSTTEKASILKVNPLPPNAPRQAAPTIDDSKDNPEIPSHEHFNTSQVKPSRNNTLADETPKKHVENPNSERDALASGAGPVEDSSFADVESEFEEGDTMVHNELEDSPEERKFVQPAFEDFSGDNDSAEKVSAGLRQTRPKPLVPADYTVIITTDEQDSPVLEPPQTPRSRRGSVGSMSSEMSFESSPPSFIEESPSVRNATNRAVRAPRPELNAAMAKRRPVKGTSDESVANPPWPPTRFAQKPTNSAEDLERKISDILTTIPAHIRLTSGPGADAPEVKSARGVAAKSSRGYLRAARSVSGLKSPELTLSPAKSEYDSANAASGRKSAAALRSDNDIKLYHLTQPGKEHPIKLFIRRVGENGERVMVRVGGGWADLGEYLRQYAEHHGRRTVSDGKFEILGLEVKNSENSPARPESAMSKKDRRFSGGYPTASPTTTPIKSSGLAISKDEIPPPMPSFTSTPGIAEETSVPSTNSSQRSWQGNEVGLAGPKAKKLDLSGEKLDWIEGMMKQARTVSGNVVTANHTPTQRDDRAESRSESRSDSRAGSRAGAKKGEFGDLGKVGGTKRIFMRGGQPSVSEH